MARLEPTLHTIKRLFALSGNECAYPSCNLNLVQNSGVIIAEICHIEAAEPGGGRFNPGQSDEERRSFENLILLCANHHRITDDPQVSVGEMRQMKSKHEVRFVSDHYTPPDPVIGELLRRFGDRHEARAAFVATFTLLREVFPFRRVRVLPRGQYAYSVEESRDRRIAVFVEPFEQFGQTTVQEPHFRDRFYDWAVHNLYCNELHLALLLDEQLALDSDEVLVRHLCKTVEDTRNVDSRIRHRHPPTRIFCAIFNRIGEARLLGVGQFAGLLDRGGISSSDQKGADVAAQAWYMGKWSFQGR